MRKLGHTRRLLIASVSTGLVSGLVFATGAVSRIGFVVPKHGHSSVARNRLKRRLRELGRMGILATVRGASPGFVIDVRFASCLILMMVG